MAGSAKEVADAYARYCAQAIMGDSDRVVALKSAGEKPTEMAVDPTTRIDFFDNIVNSDGWTTGRAEITSVDFLQTDGGESATFAGGERVTLIIRADIGSGIQRPIIGFLVKDRLGQSLFGHNTFDPLRDIEGMGGDGKFEARFQFVMPLLPNGEYSMTVALADGDLEDHVQHHWIHDAVIIKVICPKPRYGLVGIPFDSIVLERVAD
jgi:lipopolysaccharide transport system ATP-binding protein